MLLENQILEWFWYQKEFLKNEIVKRVDDDVQLKGNEEWVTNIERPQYLEDINRIVVYAIMFFKKDGKRENFYFNAEVTINNSNHIWC